VDHGAEVHDAVDGEGVVGACESGVSWGFREERGGGRADLCWRSG
jgi:hypothetical protein